MQCGNPIGVKGVIKLGHGSGGKLSADLMNEIFLPNLGESFGGQLEDAALVAVGRENIAVTTDSYVVKPYRFPGGDIGSLSVHGTVNDLAMRGAQPRFISAAFIVEEGFALDELADLTRSMRGAAIRCGVTLVAGDTKVVNKGACDGVFITTTGIGVVAPNVVPPAATRATAGDVVIVSGEIGMHGMAVLCAREDLQLEHEITSDSAPLHEISAALMSLSPDVHVLRDITRGGVASVLSEIAESSQCGIEIDEAKIPVHVQVAAACELLGLDPLYVACEGRMVIILPESLSEACMEILAGFEESKKAAVVGSVTDEHRERVIMRSRIGGRRFVERLAGDQLPRIC